MRSCTDCSSPLVDLEDGALIVDGLPVDQPAGLGVVDGRACRVAELVGSTLCEACTRARTGRRLGVLREIEALNAMDGLSLDRRAQRVCDAIRVLCDEYAPAYLAWGAVLATLPPLGDLDGHDGVGSMNAAEIRRSCAAHGPVGRRERR